MRTKFTHKLFAVLLTLVMALPLLFSLPTAILASPTNDYARLTPVGQSQATVKVYVGQALTDNCTVQSISGNIIYVDLNPCDNWSGHTYNQLWQLPYASDLWNDVGAVESIENIASAQYNLHEGANTMLQNGENIINYHFKDNGGGGGGDTHLHNFWLAFDANGGTGAPPTMYKYSDDPYHGTESFTIPYQEPTWEWHTFLGWSRTRDGEADYHVGNSIIVFDGETATLYAVWQDNTPPATEAPTPELTPVPTPEPTPVPTPEPTPVPTSEPTPVPTAQPTDEPLPTVNPTTQPTDEPIPTVNPTVQPTDELMPTTQPTDEPIPTVNPTVQPTEPPKPPHTGMVGLSAAGFAALTAGAGAVLLRKKRK